MVPPYRSVRSVCSLWSWWFAFLAANKMLFERAEFFCREPENNAKPGHRTHTRTHWFLCDRPSEHHILNLSPISRVPMKHSLDATRPRAQTTSHADSTDALCKIEGAVTFRFQYLQGGGWSRRTPCLADSMPIWTQLYYESYPFSGGFHRTCSFRRAWNGTCRRI
jgi:hypothetical protein